jgi:hypothetical protein
MRRPTGWATADLRDAFGRERNHWVLAPPWPACGRDALREKLRECSGPDSSKSGDQLPKGAGVLSKRHEGDSTKSRFLRLGPSPQLAVILS